MLPTPRPAFIRRANRYGTTESLCPACLVIVAAAPRETDLQRAEQGHACDPAMLGLWNELVNQIQGEAGRRRRRPSQSKPFPT